MEHIDTPLQSHVRDSGFETSCCHFECLASLFPLHCSSSLSCMKEYLPVDSGGYLYVVIAAKLNASQISSDCVRYLD